MELGKRIRQLRINKGVTQETLASALGVTYQAVSRWENGITTPDCVHFLVDSEHAVYTDWDTANHNKTISFLQEMVERFPNEFRYYCALIYNLIADRRVREAEAYLSEFERCFDKPEWVPIFKAKIALADCRKADAIAIIEETYRSYPDDEGTVFDMAAFGVCMRFYVRNAPYRLFVDLEYCKQVRTAT